MAKSIRDQIDGTVLTFCQFGAMCFSLVRGHFILMSLVAEEEGNEKGNASPLPFCIRQLQRSFLLFQHVWRKVAG